MQRQNLFGSFPIGKSEWECMDRTCPRIASTCLAFKEKQASAGHHKRQKQSIKLLKLFPAAKNSSRLSDIVKLTLQDLLKIEKLFLGH